jgi:HEAT repeat protein
VRALGDGNDTVRAAALEALRGIGKDATASLRRALGDDRAEARLYAAKTLGLLGPEARQSVPALAKALKDRDARVRAAAAEALGRMGLAAKGAVPELVEALRDKNLRAQTQAAVTLVGLASGGAPEVLDRIRAADRTGRWAGALVRARLGPVRPEVVAQRIKELGDGDANVRLRAALALAPLAGRAPAAADALKKALKDDVPEVRMVAAQALAAAAQGKDARLILAVRDQAQRDMLRLQEERAARLLELRGLEAQKMAERALEARKMAERGFRGQRRPAVIKAMNDPVLQAGFDRFIGAYISTKSQDGRTGPMGRGNLLTLRKLMSQQMDAALKTLGPEAIPALVKGVNYTAAYRLGFC